MFDFFSKIIDRFDRGLSPWDKTILIGLLLVISVLGIVLAFRYYDYIQDDPEFCSSCHLMEDAYLAWKRSGHSHIVCQGCHQLNMMEQNRLLIKFVFTSDRTPEPHGAETPWKLCMKCHWDEAGQGVISVSKSIGHARHVHGESLACLACHSRRGHSFRPDKTACLSCHQNWSVHGIGMGEVTCFECHPFSPKKKGGAIPDRERCLSCHRESSRSSFPQKVPMARLNCYECHRPHTNIKPSEKDCLRCHTREVLERKAVHQTRKRCTTCHVPHRWVAQ